MLTLIGISVAQTTIISQAPDQISGSIADADLGASKADNFILSAPRTITQIRIWGFFAGAGTPPATDNFAVIFHSDATGLPGTTVASEGGVPSTRVATGLTIPGPFNEYEFVLTLASPVTLGPGTYWIEIYNDTTGDADDDFVWETGTLDPTNGIIGLGSSGTAPGTVWANVADFDLALEIAEELMPVPTMTEWGMVIFMVLAGIGSVYYLRRKRIAA